MRTYRTTRGPFTEAVYFPDQEIETICLDELRNCGLLPQRPAPIHVERFVEKRFGVNVEPAPLPPGVLGYTAFAATGVVGVFVSEELEAEQSRSGQRRWRTTVAHEAGHGLLHAHLFALAADTPLFADISEPAKPKVLCRDDTVGTNASYDGSWWEVQANKAMGHLLMPRPLVALAVADFLEPVGLLGLRALPAERLDEAARQLADVFDVNPVVARIRLQALYGRVSPSAQLSL